MFLQNKFCSNFFSFNANSSKYTTVSVEGCADNLIDHPHGVSPGQTMHQTTMSKNGCQKNYDSSNTGELPNQAQKEYLSHQVLHAEKMVQPNVITNPDSSFHHLEQVEDSASKRPIAANTFVPIQFTARQGQKSQSTDDEICNNLTLVELFDNAETSSISVPQDPCLRRFTEHSSSMNSQKTSSNQSASATQASQSTIGRASIDGRFDNHLTTNQRSAFSITNRQKGKDGYQSATMEAGQEEATSFDSAALNTKMPDFLGMNSNVNFGTIPNIYSQDMYASVPGLPLNGICNIPFTQPFCNGTITPVIDPSVNLTSPLLQTYYQAQASYLMGHMSQFGGFVKSNKHTCPIATTESSGCEETTSNGCQNKSGENSQASFVPPTTATTAGN